MILPYNTDAPIYHWPVATVGLIVVNTAVLVHFMTAPDPAEALWPWILQYGTGLHPEQWVTANFVHLGFWHLFGNMFCLWGFGLVVEGKLGWWKFLAVYLGMGIVQCALEQAVVPGSLAVGSCGASGIIFGLLAISLVWAPENDMNCFMLLGIYPITFDVNLLTYSGLMVGLQILTVMLSGMSYGSEALHLIGAVVGLGVGVGMFKLGWVDCEGWDLFSVLAGRHGESSDERSQRKPRQAAPDTSEADRRRAAALAQVQQTILEGRYALAYAAHQRMAQSLAGWRLGEPHFLKMIAGYHQEQKFAESIPLMVEYLGSYTERAGLVRLKLAEILLRHAGRPAQALRVLAKIPEGVLDAPQTAYRRRLEQAAQRSAAEGALELQTEDW